MAKKKSAIIAIMFSLIVGIVLYGIVVLNHASNANILLDRATLITSENAALIGKEVRDDTPLTATNGPQENPSDISSMESNSVVVSFSDEVLHPTNIENFEVEDNITPELIIPNGSAATFGQSKTVGWRCETSDELVYRFEKYPSEVEKQQTLVVGYILDGVMYPGEKFLDLNGEYKHTVKEGGEYFIYVINAASDPLSLKNGSIHVEKSEEEEK